MSTLNNSNSILSTYFLSGAVQSAFIHSFIKYVLGAFLVQGLTARLRRQGDYFCWLQKPVLCHDAVLAFISLHFIFPKKGHAILTSKEASLADIGQVRRKQAWPPSQTPYWEFSVWLLGCLLTMWPWARRLILCLKFLQLHKEENSSTYLIGWRWGAHAFESVKNLTEWLAHTQAPVKLAFVTTTIIIMSNSSRLLI